MEKYQNINRQKVDFGNVFPRFSMIFFCARQSRRKIDFLWIMAAFDFPQHIFSTYFLQLTAFFQQNACHGQNANSYCFEKQ